MVDVNPLWLVEHKKDRWMVMENPNQMESKYKLWVTNGSKQLNCDSYERRGISYDVDFHLMIQRRQDTNVRRKILRASNPHDSRGRFHGP